MAKQLPTNGSSATTKKVRTRKKKQKALQLPVTWSMEEAGKMANFPGDRTRLFRWARKKRFLLGNNQPVQKYLTKGWFVLTLKKFNFSPVPIPVTRVTILGLAELQKRILKEFPPCLPCRR